MNDGEAYNPLAKENLGRSVVETLLRQVELPLGGLGSFRGAGVYAIYYRGEFPAYRRLAEKNREIGTLPIYVGKAVPKGSRKGFAPSAYCGTTALSERLREHASSIRAVENLAIGDFSCRSLVVDDIWIPLGESLIIDRFKPIWNVLLDGFGNHDPGGPRQSGKRPRWDEVHPGRTWAIKCQPPAESREQLLSKIEEYFESL